MTAKTTAKQRVERFRKQESELNAKSTNYSPSLVTAKSLRGIGIVSALNVRVTTPKHVRRNEGYIAKNGARIPAEPAPYSEFTKDVQRGRPKADQCWSIKPIIATGHRVNPDTGEWEKTQYETTRIVAFNPSRKSRRTKQTANTMTIVEERKQHNLALLALCGNNSVETLEN
jgi:hypothetical protein